MDEIGMARASEPVRVAKYFPAGFLSDPMADRCPECYAELPEDAIWVCPTCRYTLRTPGSAKVGVGFMVLGLVLLGTYIAGPERIGLESGAIPTDLAALMIANYPLMVIGAFGLGAFLAAAGALLIRREQGRAFAA
ncbi:MAG TPA: hypothetical protein VJ224_03120 [Thermoplasmata archaeon]|nr:hypothetical protein [Thermoplasmata archaeon]